MRPLEGRRLWFVGIGGAGMSRATRCVAQAWGAEVGGWDRDAIAVRRAGSSAAGIPVTIGHDAASVPDGCEVVVSSAIGRTTRGRPRA